MTQHGNVVTLLKIQFII